MTFKRQFITIVFIMLILAISLSAVLYSIKKSTFIEYETKHTHEQRKNEFNSIIETRKTLLIAIATSLTKNNEVHAAYLEDNRDIIIDSFEDMWKTFQDGDLVSEIHFFKSPATSFVNFSDVTKYNIDVKDIRQDIAWISSTFTPSTHFLVCRLFPGLRATYPIVINSVLYGSLSLGIDLQKINDYIQATHPEVVSYFILNDEKLKHSLTPNKYTLLTNNRSNFNEYKVFGTNKNLEFINLTENYIYKDTTLYSIFPIKDFNEEIIGYFIYEDRLDTFIDVLFNYTLLYILMFLCLGLLSVYVFWRLLNAYNKDVDNILFLLESLNKKDFHAIKENTTHNTYAELHTIENKIYKASDDIQMYIELLSKEIKDYTHKAYRDALTDTFNRRALEDIGNKLLTKDRLASKTTSLIILDIDDFKKVNDTYGHSIGDLALKQLSNTVKAIIRKDDLFVRYGGEEFVILLPNTIVSSALDVAQKIRISVEKDILSVNDFTINFTISIGISETIKSDITLEELLDKADVNLYTAKNNGKNCVVI